MLWVSLKVDFRTPDHKQHFYMHKGKKLLLIAELALVIWLQVKNLEMGQLQLWGYRKIP